MAKKHGEGAGKLRSEGPERSGGPSDRARRPDPEVLAAPQRRKFTAQYKLRILEEAEACDHGEVAALLRREGLYSSHLASWRRLRREGALSNLSKPRGPTSASRDPVTKENEKLRRENARLRQRLQQAEVILEIQKKASEILGIPLNHPGTGDDE